LNLNTSAICAVKLTPWDKIKQEYKSKTAAIPSLENKKIGNAS
jgi:hypothetical protein